jgi:hypothetical protein
MIGIPLIILLVYFAVKRDWFGCRARREMDEEAGVTEDLSAYRHGSNQRALMSFDNFHRRTYRGEAALDHRLEVRPVPSKLYHYTACLHPLTPTGYVSLIFNQQQATMIQTIAGLGLVAPLVRPEVILVDAARVNARDIKSVAPLLVQSVSYQYLEYYILVSLLLFPMLQSLQSHRRLPFLNLNYTTHCDR